MTRTMTGLYLLYAMWPQGESYLIARNLDVFQCAGQAAMNRMADERWQYRCQLVTFNAFRIFTRTKPEEMTQ